VSVLLCFVCTTFCFRTYHGGWLTSEQIILGWIILQIGMQPTCEAQVSAANAARRRSMSATEFAFYFDSIPNNFLILYAMRLC
jgi:hypothetical protein